MKTQTKLHRALKRTAYVMAACALIGVGIPMDSEARRAGPITPREPGDPTVPGSPGGPTTPSGTPGGATTPGTRTTTPTTGGRGTGATTTTPTGTNTSGTGTRTIGERTPDRTISPRNIEIALPGSMSGERFAVPSASTTARDLAHADGTFAVGGVDAGGHGEGGDEKYMPQTALNMQLVMQGPYDYNLGGTMMTNMLTAQGLVPLVDPYTGQFEADVIPGSVVDWVLVEFRQDPMQANPVAQIATFLRMDGMLVGLDGEPEVMIDYYELPPGDYFVVVRHRNQLDIMTSQPTPLMLGTSPHYPVFVDQAMAWQDFQPAMENMGNGVYAMIAGDAVPDGYINAMDHAQICNTMGAFGYEDTDITLDGIVNADDYVLSINNTFRATQVP